MGGVGEGVRVADPYPLPPYLFFRDLHKGIWGQGEGQTALTLTRFGL